MESLLPYEFEIIEQALSEDSLSVIARGLCMERIFAQLLRPFCVKTNLIIVVNATKDDITCLKDYLKDTSHPPRSLTTETTSSATERVKIYRNGGVLFVTSRILILDFLTNRIPHEFLNGIFIYRAEKLLLSHQEGFIARLYRQKNTDGRVCGFSEAPTAFLGGFGKADRIMRMCNMKKLNIWPRFHISISQCFDATAPEVLENHSKLTPLMEKIQGNILELIKACCSELKRENSSFAMDDFSVESVISHDFERYVRSIIDPISFSIGYKTNQLIADLKTLRNILISLLQRDCVSFYHFINDIRKNEEVFSSNTGWLFLKEADNLFANCKERVFGAVNVKGVSNTCVLEESPKWVALKAILKEIGSENEKLKDKSKGRIFIGVRDGKSSELLRKYLYTGIQFLQDELESGSAEKRNDDNDELPKNIEKAKKEIDTVKSMEAKAQMKDQKLISDFVASASKSSNSTENQSEDDDIMKLLSDDALVQCDEEPITLFHSYKSSYNLIRNLYHLRPRYIILFDPHVDFVRQVEVYSATVKKEVRVYFMVYKDSVEEQSFLVSLQKEKLAFDKLMEEKSTMADENRFRNREAAGEDLYGSATNTRDAGCRSAADSEGSSETPRVIVDMREFRSDLPPMLHQRGMDIEPVTLEVGDYLLSDDLCVERKSLSDLVGSLNSGRLYTQATAMCRLYKKPILLIEFDPCKPFNMSEKGKLSQDVSLNDIQTRISLLTVHFAGLKIIWSQGAQQTASLFADLKRKRPEPDVNKLPGIESAETSIFDISFDKNFNFAARDLINKLPGLTSKSEKLIFDNFLNFQHLSEASEQAIHEKTSRNDIAGNIVEFMNHSHKAALHASKSKNDGRKVGPRFRPGKK